MGTRSLDCGGRNKWARNAQCWRQHHQQFPAVKLTGCPEFNPIGSKRACGINSKTQGREKAGAMGLGWCKGWPQEVSSHREFNPRDRSRSRLVVSVAGGNGNGWFKNLLLSKIEIPDVDLGGFDDDDEDMNGDGDEGEGEGDDEDDEDLEDVDFEFSREPAGDEVDELIEDDTRFARWKRKIDAKNELREFQATGRDPDSTDWEDWLDDTWEQYDVNLAGEDGWYQPAPDWEKDGVPRDPPTKPERGMRRTIKELFFRIFEREEEVADDLQFEERVFRFTSQSTVSTSPIKSSLFHMHMSLHVHLNHTYAHRMLVFRCAFQSTVSTRPTKPSLFSYAHDSTCTPKSTHMPLEFLFLHKELLPSCASFKCYISYVFCIRNLYLHVHCSYVTYPQNVGFRVLNRLEKLIFGRVFCVLT